MLSLPFVLAAGGGNAPGMGTVCPSVSSSGAGAADGCTIGVMVRWGGGGAR